MANNKYDVLIQDKYLEGNTVTIDVYSVLEAFNVRNSALQHLIKKALMAGNRGHKDVLEDCQDIIDSAVRAKELETQRQYIEWANERDKALNMEAIPNG
ncbi:hypothetical protein [Vibrio cholerae]|uniref:hypothetical protein n=2 Tax=root TaxID=1 RepID=UPI0004E5E2C6|nr:hypothetical protein [Vibrio cholerae]YP_009056213.1 hypothetical protein LD36_gp01 [Vibrio phage ICP2_2013_A_Haiti]AII27115.1 hypothetical protein ICP22013AHaiti_1 [Vibrio phage ICP2_2013_A_Haiti]